ncbi:hypothetical protein [Pedococcus cremeus]|uniref:hypothetical protein n=1 Tax=Pedococcus cremeus TaxID=587636 RepID=UPI00115F8816|nr:hypothetical protein [Pedococcus cremeus]
MSIGPFRTKVAGLMVRLPAGTLLRIGNAGTSPVRAIITDDGWVLNGRSRFWQVELGGHAPRARHTGALGGGTQGRQGRAGAPGRHDERSASEPASALVLIRVVLFEALCVRL